MKRKCRYYLFNDALLEVDSTSKAAYPPSYLPIMNYGELMIEIKYRDGFYKIKKFHELSDSYENQAILMFHDMWNYREDERIDLSEDLIDSVSEHVEKSIRNTIKKYHSFASEDMITAVLGDRLYEAFNDNDINVDIRFQSYSSVKKEPVNGADLSFIFDIKDKVGRRIIKTILIQSKKVNDPTVVKENAPDLHKQIEKMEKITEQSYVFQYSETGFRAYNTINKDIKSISSLFREVLQCQSGDRRKSVLASSLDSKHIIQLSIDESDSND